MDNLFTNKPSTLFENQQLGNFNTLMGYFLGANGYRRPFSINVYQQTYEHDKTIGDVFGNLGGKYFIMEFKRNKAGYKDELKKEHRNKLLKKLTEDFTLNTISEKGHFMCHGETRQGTDKNEQDKEKQIYEYIEYLITPYKYIDPNYSGINHNTINGVEDFTLNIAFQKGHPSIGMSYEEMEIYLKVLKDCVGNNKYETSGAVTSFSLETGIVSVEFNSLEELDKKLNLGIEMNYNLRQSLDNNKHRRLGM